MASPILHSILMSVGVGVGISSLIDLLLSGIGFLHLTSYPKAFSGLLILAAVTSVTNDLKRPLAQMQMFPAPT